MSNKELIRAIALNLGLINGVEHQESQESLRSFSSRLPFMGRQPDMPEETQAESRSFSSRLPFMGRQPDMPDESQTESRPFSSYLPFMGRQPYIPEERQPEPRSFSSRLPFMGRQPYIPEEHSTEERVNPMSSSGFITLLGLGLLAFIFWQGLPDIKRYMRIRSM